MERLGLQQHWVFVHLYRCRHEYWLYMTSHRVRQDRHHDRCPEVQSEGPSPNQNLIEPSTGG